MPINCLTFFLYNLYIFVWIQHSCLANTVFALDPSNKKTLVYKRMYNEEKVPFCHIQTRARPAGTFALSDQGIPFVIKHSNR